MVGADVQKVLEKYADRVLRIDLGCGRDKQPGFLGIDRQDVDGVDIVHDLETFPWPLPDECASLLVASHLVEHINPANGGFLRFMDEAWRVLRPGGTFMISTPYAGSIGYWADPTHVNGCTEMTWGYFDPWEPRAQDSFGYRLWDIYKPKPWRIQENTWDIAGTIEVALRKMPEEELPEPIVTGKGDGVFGRPA